MLKARDLLYIREWLKLLFIFKLYKSWIMFIVCDMFPHTWGEMNYLPVQMITPIVP